MTLLSSRYPKVVGTKYVPNKLEQLWIRGPDDSEGYFTVRNIHTGTLLTGMPNDDFIVKTGVRYNDKNKEFDFSGALPRGIKVLT